MAEPENLVLVCLRRIDRKVDRLIDDVRDLKVRMALLNENMVVVQRRLDRVGARLDRVERRLGPVEAAC